jgi:hypothetical protein
MKTVCEFPFITKGIIFEQMKVSVIHINEYYDKKNNKVYEREMFL